MKITYIRKARCLLAYLSMKFSSFTKSIWRLMMSTFQFFVFHSNPFWIQLCYFIFISILGFISLKNLKPKDGANSPKSLDLLFMSVSASTVSSMSTVEMEIFSVSQLWVLFSLVLIGAEVFTTALGLQFSRVKFKIKVEAVSLDLKSRDGANHLDSDDIDLKLKIVDDLVDRECSKQDAIRYMGFVVLAYLVNAVVSGSLIISLYLSLVSSVGDVLRSRRIPILTFSIFTTVSSFGGCGFIPTNENMAIFKKDSALLILIILQILAGGTLFPPCLRFMIWVLEKVTKKREFGYILQNPREARCRHLLSRRRSAYLVFSVTVFILVQLILFCSLEWNSEALQDLQANQKVMVALFQSVNARHAGESVVDISALSPAILVLYTLMMYLPAYTSFFPFIDDDHASLTGKHETTIKELLKGLIFSKITYLAIFTIFICITERNALLEDPLNFNVFNIMFEVISAYGNVGFSTGYNCRRKLKQDINCKDVSYGFVGKWSDKGKLILIGVMLFGRLKSINRKFALVGLHVQPASTPSSPSPLLTAGRRALPAPHRLTGGPIRHHEDHRGEGEKGEKVPSGLQSRGLGSGVTPSTARGTVRDWD